MPIASYKFQLILMYVLGPTTKRKISCLSPTSQGGSISSRVRTTTKAKTEEAEKIRNANALVGNFKTRTKPTTVKTLFSQKQLLEEGLETEVNDVYLIICIYNAKYCYISFRK